MPGQPVYAYLYGRGSSCSSTRAIRRDPDGSRGRRGRVARRDDHRLALTHVDPDHAAGAESLAEQLGIEVYVGPGGGRSLPYAAHELGDGDEVVFGGEGSGWSITAISTPGPRPDHVAYILSRHGEGTALIGDLDGHRGARMMPGPVDDAAWAESRTGSGSRRPVSGCMAAIHRRIDGGLRRPHDAAVAKSSARRRSRVNEELGDRGAASAAHRPRPPRRRAATDVILHRARGDLDRPGVPDGHPAGIGDTFALSSAACGASRPPSRS